MWKKLASLCRLDGGNCMRYPRQISETWSLKYLLKFQVWVIVARSPQSLECWKMTLCFIHQWVYWNMGCLQVATMFCKVIKSCSTASRLIIERRRGIIILMNSNGRWISSYIFLTKHRWTDVRKIQHILVKSVPLFWGGSLFPYLFVWGHVESPLWCGIAPGG